MQKLLISMLHVMCSSVRGWQIGWKYDSSLRAVPIKVFSLRHVGYPQQWDYWCCIQIQTLHVAQGCYDKWWSELMLHSQEEGFTWPHYMPLHLLIKPLHLLLHHTSVLSLTHTNWELNNITVLRTLKSICWKFVNVRSVLHLNHSPYWTLSNMFFAHVRFPKITSNWKMHMEFNLGHFDDNKHTSNTSMMYHWYGYVATVALFIRMC